MVLQSHSVNSAIDLHLCSLSYISVDQVARRAMQLVGVGSHIMAKIDIKSQPIDLFQFIQEIGIIWVWNGMAIYM